MPPTAPFRLVRVNKVPKAVNNAMLSKQPYSSVFEVRRLNDGTFLGSAFAFGSDRLATAAHCIENDTRVRLIGSGVDTKASTRFYSEWEANPTDENDVGLIVPDSPLSLPTLKLTQLADDTPSTTQINLIGFAETGTGIKVHEDSGRLVSVHPGTIRYFASSLPGQSGGPVMLLSSSPNQVVAINIAGDDDRNLPFKTNAGVRINSTIKTWLTGAL
jgi:V8-like Glu-specific endopeptidase